jgi:hypothetical protein
MAARAAREADSSLCKAYLCPARCTITRLIRMVVISRQMRERPRMVETEERLLLSQSNEPDSSEESTVIVERGAFLRLG